ncbi:MAG: pyrrolo-quinoline quinone, partial [Rubrivivax sp.]|nr:pyrrolo-quinoline quinone [Rubrivivax sp.]
MKVAVQSLACAAALSGLLFGAASHATNLAELPLKTAVLAKPNVIFGMDDSGSMDWEILLGTNDGLAWWNGSTAWDSATNRPLKVSGGDSNRLSYLFPMGTDRTKGGQLYSNGTGSGDHRVVPPTAQFAWLRSNAFNPLYYNTWVTYPAWSPAYVNSALQTYANAPVAAAPSHPGPLSSSATTLNVGSDWTSGSTNFGDDNFAFVAIGGMVLPVGTSVVATNSTSGICSGSTRQTLTAATVVPSGARCLARVPYYPATFWQRTTCPVGDLTCTAVPDCTAVNPVTTPGASCVAAPDGVGKLRRYEVKSGNTFPSGRSHAAELQNFANWFSYYRKRKLMLAGAMGRALEPITGVRMGVVPFGSTPTVTMYDADASSAASNRYRVAGQFYLNATGSPQGTPTHRTVKH